MLEALIFFTITFICDNALYSGYQMDVTSFRISLTGRELGIDDVSRTDECILGYGGLFVEALQAP